MLPRLLTSGRSRPPKDVEGAIRWPPSLDILGLGGGPSRRGNWLSRGLIDGPAAEPVLAPLNRRFRGGKSCAGLCRMFGGGPEKSRWGRPDTEGGPVLA
jgi:hypothetical protein